MTLKTWEIPGHVLQQTEQAFRSGQHEVFVIWTAPLVDPDAAEDQRARRVTRAVVPAQKPGRSAFGVWVHIDGSELQRIQLDNYNRGERSWIQLHTHPSADVEMSQLDREWEVVRHEGALSIIVPFYGRRGMAGFPGVNVYEREADDWRLWSTREVTSRLVIV